MSKSVKVLLVEDSPQDAELLVHELERAGYSVTYKRVDTERAMKAALSEGGWDAVFSDYSMPQFSGMAALDVMKEVGIDLPFIIVSGTIGEETAVDALKAGAHDFLVKNRLARLIPAFERERREHAARIERARLEQQLRQAQKMEAIGHLAGGIAHDFNNMLTTITGYSEMILDQIGPDKPISADLAEIRKAADRAAQLTRQLLAFSRQQVLRIANLDVNEVVRNMRGMMQRLMREDIVIRLQLDEGPQLIRADRVQLEQVLLNLAANARDAMEHGGTFTIATSHAAASAVAALVGTRASGASYVQLSVSDTGAGMDARTRERLFEPFFTTKELGKGTGLGLATVYGIVKQLNGYIVVASEPGKGAAFTLFFPVSDVTESPQHARKERLSSAPVATERETILLVEDEQGVRTLVARTLERYGYHVLQASSAQEALAIAAEKRAIHLALSDVVMPVMSGPEMVRRLRDLRPECKVLFMSGYAGRFMASSGLLDASAELIEKPFSAHQLLQAVRKLLDTP